MYGKKVTVLSSNKRLVRFFELELSFMGAYVSTSKNSASGNTECDLIIIDVDTTDVTPSNCACPVIRVSEKLHDDGDILLWPVSISELSKKCNGIFNTQSANATDGVIDTLFVLDAENGIALLGNTQIRFSRTELLVIDELCVNCGNTVTRQRIMEIIGADTGNISDVYICMLRKKLEKPLGKRLIFTKRSIGYYTNLRIVK